RGEPSPSSDPPPPRWVSGDPFPTAAFSDISEDPVSVEAAAEFEAALREMAGRGAMSATVMSPDGTWSGAVGKANRVRDVGINDQFAIGSVGKTMVAAQVMLMVERGEVDLDDPAADHLPPNLDFDTNGATIRHLLNMQSGIPDIYEVIGAELDADPRRVWTTVEMLELVPDDRGPTGVFSYTNTGALLLEPVIEHVSGRRVVDVMRDGGVLDVEGTDRLIYQPDERPTEPMALPNGGSIAEHRKNGGYLPSRATATAGPTTGSQASDAPSFARWWRAFCAGEIVSQESLTEMAIFDDGYGLGLDDPYGGVVGHVGGSSPYSAWAGCLPHHGTVIAVLHNRDVDDMGGMAGPLVRAVIAQSSE
ncbi:MAG: beta-lactamase family protein, partial [Actinobacteria bacterium]|nr:beta-lactamase family protein [Actinomycetota bacterium]